MADLSIKYKNAEIASLSESGTKTLTTKGMYCEDDITVTYTKPEVASGITGTPTANKSAVSNHSVTVTPSVTNTTGWIEGGTKTGNGVTVSASELVSGSETLTQNGYADVTNLASVTVDIPFISVFTGSTDPSAFLGNNGDIYLKV